MRVGPSMTSERQRMGGKAMRLPQTTSASGEVVAILLETMFPDAQDIAARRVQRKPMSIGVPLA